MVRHTLISCSHMRCNITEQMAKGETAISHFMLTYEMQLSCCNYIRNRITPLISCSHMRCNRSSCTSCILGSSSHFMLTYEMQPFFSLPSRQSRSLISCSHMRCNAFEDGIIKSNPLSHFMLTYEMQQQKLCKLHSAAI